MGGRWKPLASGKITHLKRYRRRCCKQKHESELEGTAVRSGRTKQEDSDIYETIQTPFTEKRYCEIGCSDTRGHKGVGVRKSPRLLLL